MRRGPTLAEFLSCSDLVLDRPVIDKTGITARFDIHTGIFARRGHTQGFSLVATWRSAGQPRILPARRSLPRYNSSVKTRADQKDLASFLVIDHVRGRLELIDFRLVCFVDSETKSTCWVPIVERGATAPKASNTVGRKGDDPSVRVLAPRWPYSTPIGVSEE